MYIEANKLSVVLCDVELEVRFMVLVSCGGSFGVGYSCFVEGSDLWCFWSLSLFLVMRFCRCLILRVSMCFSAM